MVIPLTRRRVSDGELYRRPDSIEQQLDRLLALPRHEVLQRLRVRDRRRPDHLPSEVLVHLIRGTRTNNADDYFGALYAELLHRVHGALPRAEQRLAGGEEATSADREQVREEVVAWLTEAVVEDRSAPSGNLDIFECRFDLAVAKLRQRAWRKIYRERGRRHALDPDELSEAVQEGAAEFASLRAQLFSDPTSQMRVRAAISLLPDRDRRIMTMLIEGFPIESQDAAEPSISRLLDCDEKTVRNRRDAFVGVMKRLIDMGPES